MVQARRAMQDDEELDITVDLSADSTQESSPSPRRGAPKPAWKFTKFIAPLAITGVVVAGSVALSKTGSTEAATEATPAVEVSSLDVSRNYAREPLASPTPSPTPSPMETPSAQATEATPEPTPETTESVEPTSEASMIFDPSALGNATGEMYTASSVNIRTGPGTDYDVRVTLDGGTAVTITDITKDGWQQIVYKDAAGWVSADYLSESAPETPAVSSSASCTSSSAKSIESGLTAKSVSVLRAVCAAFPDITTYGGYRADSGYHGQGRAIDVMVSGERGWEIARWLRENASELGVIEVIYSQQIWTTQRASEGWRAMSDRGSATANHYDHVHISVAG